MRRCATGASSTKPRCALRWRASMTAARRSGQRALFERGHERDGRYAAARWRSACRPLADSVAKLLKCPAAWAIQRRLAAARDFVNRGGRVAVTMGAGAKERSSNLSSQVLQEIAKIEAEIDRTEAQAIERLAAPPDNQIQQIELLGKLMLYDKDLSVNRNEACAFKRSAKDRGKSRSAKQSLRD